MSAITFKPIYQERIWGGRNLETFYHRQLPDPSIPYGEAWEIVDRDNAQSIVSEGKFAEKSLHDLWIHHREEIFGKNLPQSPRFPILVKILDSSDDLSIQVHPPAHLAESMHGEPKTEMWFIADAKPGAKLYIGLKQGTKREDFHAAIHNGSVVDLIHSVNPHKGDAIFIPSGRLHAIGAGFLIHEIQQNSDTTYRVFDWNRTDSNGNPRDLHIDESLACIDFSDIEPEITIHNENPLVSCDHFITNLHHLKTGESIRNPRDDQFSLIILLSGSLETRYRPGQSLLLPASSNPLVASENTSLLQITLPCPE
jgi:mannose-6-phosphate isomerase